MRQDLSESAGASDYPPMVLLHGIFGKPADWDESERYFGGSCEVFAPRLPLEFKERLPLAELEFIDRCGHAPSLEKPHEFNRIVQRFLQRHFVPLHAG